MCVIGDSAVELEMVIRRRVDVASEIDSKYASNAEH